MAILIIKSILGLGFLLSVMSLTLFASAGSLGFWQAWPYLIIFATSALLITVYLMIFDRTLLASRVKAGPIAETQKTQKIIQSLASLLFIGLHIVPGLNYRFHWSNVSPLVGLISDALVALGFGIVFLVFRENTHTSGVIEVVHEQRVVTSGPYSLVRHPMYAGASILLLSSPPALGTWWAMPISALLILVIVVRLVNEEKFLSANLPGYDAYRRKVRYRLVPFLW